MHPHALISHDLSTFLDAIAHISRKFFGTCQDRSLGTGSARKGVRTRCPYRRCGVDTEIPYRLFLLILCSGESVEAEFIVIGSPGIQAVHTEFPKFSTGCLSSIGGRLPHACLPPAFPIRRQDAPRTILLAQLSRAHGLFSKSASVPVQTINVSMLGSRK